MTATAQELFASVMKGTIGPALRAAGMRGSGQSYALPSPTHFALLGFQKSQFSDSGDVMFTVNLKVVRKDFWDQARRDHPHYPTEPSLGTAYGAFEWHQRIGSLLPGGEDKWWHFRAGGDNDAMIAEVLDILTNVAVPALRKQIQSDV